jgi:hypothetical protein
MSLSRKFTSRPLALVLLVLAGVAVGALLAAWYAGSGEHEHDAAVTVTAGEPAGEAGFSDLVDAQRVLLEFALAHERAAADRAQAVARIRTLVGELPGPMPSSRLNEDGARP